MEPLPCATCQPDPIYPEHKNDQHGIWYRCPSCKKYSKAWNDDDAAIDEWNRAQKHGHPAGMRIERA